MFKNTLPLISKSLQQLSKEWKRKTEVGGGAELPDRQVDPGCTGNHCRRNGAAASTLLQTLHQGLGWWSEGGDFW